MELDEKTYILGYWCAEDKDANNWHLIMCKKDDDWIGEYRFRYHRDDDPFSGEDKKSFYTVKPNRNETEDNLIKKIDDSFEFIKLKYDGFNDKFLVQGDIEKFMDIAKTKSYMNMKIVTEDNNNEPR